MVKFFFIHIPKTAGTSFRKMLYRQFPGEDTYPTHEEIVLNGGVYPFERELAEVDRRRSDRALLLVGHYGFGAGRRFFGHDDFARLTFVRAAVPRAVSNLLHFKRHAPNMRDLSLEAIFERARPSVSNAQVRALSALPGPCTERHLEIAKVNLQRCDFVGVTERFDESLFVASQQFGWNLGARVDTNRRPADSPEVPPSLMTELEAANDLDRELYEFALRVFENRLRSARSGRDRQAGKALRLQSEY
jgi:hypothetical protein